MLVTTDCASGLIESNAWFVAVTSKAIGKKKFLSIVSYMPIPVAAPSKAWVYGRSLVVVMGSKTPEDMDICLL
jgi:hypothetical protein